MCRVQRERTCCSERSGCILWPCQGQNGNPGLKESFQLFFEYKQPKRAREHLERWMHSAMRSRLEPFKSFVRLLRGHLDGVLAWTKLRLSNGALEGMNNKIKLVSHRAFGFRSVKHYVAAIYHCCAQLPLPQRS